MSLRRLRLLSAVAVALTVALTGACASARVALPTPPSAADDIAGRRAYYDTHGPSALRTPGGPWGTAQRSFLVLRSGERVDDPRDLLPAVGADSPTGRAVAEFEQAEFVERGVLGAAVSIVAVGLATQFVGLVTFAGTADAPTPAETAALPPEVLLSAGGGAVALLGLIPLAAVPWLHDETERARQTAFLGYELALQRRLGLPTTDAVRLVGGCTPEMPRGTTLAAAPSPSAPTPAASSAEPGPDDRAPTVIE
jgi:hypothetical protein